jgi:hypothetical protein
MTLDRELNAYIKRLNEVQRKSLLEFIKTLFPFGENEESISMEQYNRELEEADAAIERGEYSTNEEVFEMTKKIISARK